MPAAQSEDSSSVPTFNPNFSHPLHEYEDFMHTQMKLKMQEDISQVRYTTMMQMRDQASDFS